MWSNIRDLIRSVTKSSDDYDEKYMKIKFNSDDQSPLNKTIDIPSMIIVVRPVSYENNKYYPQVFPDECLDKLYTQKKQKVSIFLFAFLSISVVLLIAVSIYCYLIKYKAKQKHLLPFYITNNELKKVLF